MSDALLVETNDRLWTYADYKAWELDVGERYEIIEGEAYAMTAPSAKHQSVLGEMYRQIANHLHRKPCKVFPAPYDVRLDYKEDESDTTVVQPDITVVCDPAKRGIEGCRGVPDWLIEVLSPSTASVDTVRKFNLYMNRNVRVYWIVSPEEKTVFVYLFKNSMIEKHFTYELPTQDRIKASSGCILTTSVPVNIFDGFSLNIADVFAEDNL
ncbi:MAG: Uma2 family endonuclease [Termitinemataceae bacterium]|nr:MAG: Uma2 family endonuclease [Termitinemataceae bacterium]